MSLIVQQNESLLSRLARQKPHAVVLAHPEGVQAGNVALEYAKQLDALVLPPVVANEKGVITVEVIRELYAATATKHRRPRVQLMYDADRMTESAQNALLKLLEEPPEGVHFVLLSTSPEQLLSTIRSRTVLAHITPLSKELSKQFIESRGVDNDTAIKQLLFIASGKDKELDTLISDTSYFEQQAMLIRSARDFVKSGASKRLQLLIDRSKDREVFAQYLNRIVSLLMFDISEKKILNNDQLALIDSLSVAIERVQKNGNLKLIAARIVV